MDPATALQILGGGNNPPPPGAAIGNGQQPPPSRADSVISILQQGAAGKFQPANSNAVGAFPPDGSPGSVFTSDPNLLGAELRPLQSQGASGAAYGLPPGVTLGGGFKGAGGALQPQSAIGAGSPSRGFLHRTLAGMQGVNEGIAGVLGLPVDLTAAAMNAGSRGIKSLTGYDLGQISDPVLGSQWNNEMFAKIGAEDPNYQPADAADTILRAGGRGVGQATVMLPLMAAALPEAMANTVTAPFVQAPVRSAVAATASGITGGEGQEGGHQLAQVLAPGIPAVDTVLSTAGGLLGGFAPAGVVGAVKAPAAAYRLLKAPTTAGYQENMAGGILRDASTYGTPDNLKPPPLSGNPTSLGRAANDPGLMAFENQLNRSSPQAEGAALDAATQGNQITRRALLGISGGDPNAVGPAIGASSAATSSSLDVGATAALRRVQRAMEDAGLGAGGLDRTTASLEARAELEASLKAARKTESDLWGSIDPGKSLNIATDGLKSDLDAYVASVPKMDQADLPKDVLDQIKALSPAEPMSEWTAIPKLLGAKIREAQSAGQWNRARILRDLKGVVLNRMNNLSNDDFMPAGGPPSTVAIAPKVPGQSLLQFFAGRGGIKDTGGELAALDLDKWHRGAPFRNKLVNPNGVDPDYAREAAVEAGYLPEGATTNDLLDAMAKEARGRPVYSGGQSREAGYDPTATLDQLQRWQDSQNGGAQIGSAVARYRQAVDYSRVFNTLFSNGPVRQTLKVGPGGPAVQPSQTLDKITRTPEGISQFLYATKQSTAAVGAVRDFLLRDLETKAIAPNGSLKADALRSWVAKNGAKLDEVDSTLRGRLLNASTQQDALEEVLARNEAAKQGMEQDAAQRFLGSDPRKAIGQILNARDNGKSLGQLLKAVSDNPEALEGVRASLLDWILDKASTRGADLRGEPLLNSGALDDVVRENGNAILRILSGPQQAMLAKVQEAARMNAAPGRAKLGGSPTYSLLAGDKYLDVLLGKLAARTVRLTGKAGPAIGGVGGSMVAGPVGGGIGAAVGEGLSGDIAKSLYSASRDQILALVKQGIKDPEFGRQLMMKAANSNAKIAGPRFSAYLTALPGILLNQRRAREAKAVAND